MRPIGDPKHAVGATLLVASYFRLIFTLSLGTLAAIVTLGSTWARFGGVGDPGLNDPVVLATSAVGVIFLILSAVLAANGLRQAAGGSINSVRDPLPKSGSAIENALVNDDVTETEIFRHVMVAIDEIANSDKLNAPSFMPPLLAYLCFIICAVVSIAWVTL